MYYLFGAGSNCFSIIGFVGKQNVKAIVDNNPSKVGKKYSDCLIINFDQFKKEYTNELVIISTYLFWNEVAKQLEENGIKNYVVFPRLQTSYLSAKQIIQRWELYKYKSIFFWGESVISKILTEQLQLSNKELITYSNNELSIDEINNRLIQAEVCLVMVDELKENELKVLEGHNNLIWVNNEIKELFQEQYNRLERIHNIHKGEKCFLIGNGPSLKAEDLEILLKNKVDTFGCNQIFDIYSDTIWRPNYYVVSDGMYPCEHMKEILSQDVSCFMKHFIGFDLNNSIYTYRYQENDCDDELLRFSTDITKCIYRSATVLYDMFQIAVYMGYSEIYLLGVDCNYVKGSKSNHFKKSKEPDPIDYTDKMRRMIQAYQSAKAFADANGIKIFNATRGGQLEVFQRVSFDELFYV